MAERSVLMKAVHLRSQPRQAYDDVAEHADGQNATRTTFEKPVSDQVANEPNDNAKPADLFGIPGPVSAPFDFRPGHSEEDGYHRKKQGDTSQPEIGTADRLQT